MGTTWAAATLIILFSRGKYFEEITGPIELFSSLCHFQFLGDFSEGTKENVVQWRSCVTVITQDTMNAKCTSRTRTLRVATLEKNILRPSVRWLVWRLVRNPGEDGNRRNGLYGEIWGSRWIFRFPPRRKKKLTVLNTRMARGASTGFSVLLERLLSHLVHEPPQSNSPKSSFRVACPGTISWETMS